MSSFASVETGNFLYFFFLFLLVAFVWLSRAVCKTRGKEFTRRYILVLMWMNFALHFLKQLNPFYLASFPFSIGRSSLENLCAVLIVASPFVFLYGNAYLKDYLYYLGIVSGVLVFLLPTGAIGRDLGSLDDFLEVMRFYSCHAPLVACGFLMVDRGLHRLDYRRLWAVPFLFVGANFVVLLNGLFMSFVVRFPGWPHSWEGFIDRDGFVNQSASFGPATSVDAYLGWLYPYLPPFLMTYRVDGVIHFVPCLYLFLPVALIVLLFGPPMAFPYERRHFLLDREERKQRKKMKKERKARSRPKEA